MRQGRVSRERKRRKLRALAYSNITSLNFNPHNLTYHDMLKWMGKGGFKQSIKMKPYIFKGTGRGLITEETVDSGDVIISVPENLLITPLVVLKDYLGPHMKRCCPEATGQEILSVFMMCEKVKGEASFWYPYIATLPSCYTIPAYCSRSIACALPICVRHHVLKQINVVKNSFEKLNELFTSLENSFPEFHGIFQYDFYRWAWSSVNTRCVYIECEERCTKGKSCTYHLALAPFLDLLNHHCDAQVEAGFDQEKRCYEIKSLKRFRKHSQVFINYGNHCNWQLFIEYGFVLENNFNDIIPVSPDDILSACKSINMADKFLMKKQVFQQHSTLLSNMGFCKDGLTWGMDAFLKILCTEKTIRRSSSMLYDINLNGNEKSVYKKLTRALIFVKLKDFVCNVQENILKVHTAIDVETQNVLDIAHHLCLLQQNILFEILHQMENCDMLNKGHFKSWV